MQTRAEKQDRDYLVPIATIRSCLPGLAVKAIRVCAGQYTWKEGPKACSIIGLGVGESHGGKSPAVEAVL